ncbi:MAG TPA: ABC transporter ATP-binding protein [Rhodopila sp.]|nr:ABC transporter ATP-binding protein [Rhodopila sp.]
MSLLLERIGLNVGAQVVIRDVSLLLERGTMNVLLGPTLAGKTTLMRLMAGLDRPSNGRLVLDGKDVTGVPVRRRSVAMVYQQFVNYPSLTVFENIASPLRVARVPAQEIEARVRQAAQLLRLENLLQRLPGQLSGGQQQRTAIARALVKRADLVLLDEPLANLDYKLREELREQLPRIFAESNAILVYATTEPTEALLLGGHTATMWEGQVTQHGPTPDVYRQPRNIAAARVFSDPPLNELAVRKRGATVTTTSGRDLPALGVLAHLPDGDYRLGFRCDDVTLDAAAGGTFSFPGTVAVTEISGTESFVHVDVGAGTWVCLIRGVHDWQPGARAHVQVDMRRAIPFDSAGVQVGQVAVPLEREQA